jgi:CheY-like chemotaxis protein
MSSAHRNGDYGNVPALAAHAEHEESRSYTAAAMAEPPSAPSPGTSVFDAVDQLLNDNGFPERGRVATVEAILGIPGHQARRRLSRETLWSPHEVAQLAAHFGASAYGMLSSFLGDLGTSATLQLNGQSVACTLWPGESLESGGVIAGPFVCAAPEGSRGWLVAPANERPSGVLHAVRRCLYEAVEPLRVAALDDDESMCEGLCRVLRERGVNAVAFTEPNALLQAINSTAFDAYIIDWVLPCMEPQRLLREIRTQSPHAPILILTGQIQTGAAGEDEVAAAVAAYQCQVFEKPTRALSLLAALQAGLPASRPTQGNYWRTLL